MPPTRTELADELRSLADDLLLMGSLMDYYGGLSDLSRRGHELLRVGYMVAGWAAELHKTGVGVSWVSGDDES